jgi:hypothetical protein
LKDSTGNTYVLNGDGTATETLAVGGSTSTITDADIIATLTALPIAYTELKEHD